MRSLSPRQQRILQFIGEFWQTNGYSPSIRDIKDGCDISSTSVVDYNLRILEAEGHLRRGKEVSRSTVLTGGGRQSRRVPIMGTIAAGEPLPIPDTVAWESASETLSVPEEMLGRGQVYALRVKGLSMIDALVCDGDLVLMEPTATAENGEMVAAWLKKEKEATLKRFYQEGDRVRLQPANEQMAPIYVDAANVEIQGRVRGVIRLL